MLRTRRRISILVTALTVIVLTGGIVAASIPAADGTITGCYQKINGQLRVVESADQCNPSELALTWQQEGPAGPQGPEGPQGPAGSSAGGPPYVWVCTPASFPTVGSTTRADVYVFNGGAAAANVTIEILDKSGNNLAGHTIPGSNPAATYPGGAYNVAPSNTLDVDFLTPVTGPPQGGFDGVTDVSYSVRVTSSTQPVVVSSDFWWNGPAPLPCSLLPK